MKAIAFTIAFIMLLMLNSCLNVFQPFITPDKYFRDSRLEGNWKAGAHNINITEYSKSPLSSQKIMDTGAKEKKSKKDIQDSINAYHKSYILSFSDTTYTYYFHMQMTLKSKSYFFQLAPIIYTKTSTIDTHIINDQNVPESRFNTFGTEGIMSTYSFGRLTFVNSSQLQLQFFDGDKIKDLILNGQLKTSYAFDRLYDNFLITADSNELDKLIGKYGNNDELFSSKNNYSFIKMN